MNKIIIYRRTTSNILAISEAMLLSHTWINGLFLKDNIVYVCLVQNKILFILSLTQKAYYGQFLEFPGILYDTDSDTLVNVR